MRAIFYAPIAKPDATAASGVQRMGTLMQRALAEADVEVMLPALPRTYDGRGDAEAQRRLRDASFRVGNDLLVAIGDGRVAKPDAWFSYHVYYKSPDWIGPKVAHALGIPYLIAEGSHAPKRAGGPWALGHDATTHALQAADRLLAMTAFDRFCLDQIAPGRVRDLKPFIDASEFARSVSQNPTAPAEGRSIVRSPKGGEGSGGGRASASGPPPDPASLRSPYRPPLSGGGSNSSFDSAAHSDARPHLIAVGMMRNGRKRASYALLGEALRLLGDMRLSLTIVGDGAFRAEVEAMFRPAASQHDVRFAGEVAATGIPALMASADVFAWPGLGEAYGLVFLEAQAAGLPVVACRERGVPDAVRDGETALLSVPGDAQTYAANLRRMLADRTMRQQYGAAARTFVVNERSVEAAGATLRGVLTELGLA